MGRAFERGLQQALEMQRRRRGTIVVKTIYCKSCRQCEGHGPYRYRVWRENGKVNWEYLGKVDEGGTP